MRYDIIMRNNSVHDLLKTVCPRPVRSDKKWKESHAGETEINSWPRRDSQSKKTREEKVTTGGKLELIEQPLCSPGFPDWQDNASAKAKRMRYFLTSSGAMRSLTPLFVPMASVVSRLLFYF